MPFGAPQCRPPAGPWFPRAGWLLVPLLLGAVVEAVPAQTVVVLARHGEKLAPSGDLGLSPAGRSRADALARAVAGAAIDAILVTQYRRTVETALPAAAARGLTPIVVPVGADVAAHVRDVAERVRSFPAGSMVLVVGHSNTLGPIIAALGGPDPLPICDPEYASLFILTLDSTPPARLIRASFGAPDPAGAGDCRTTPPE